MSNVTHDVRGTLVEIDSVVEGFTGFTRRVARARVTMVSQWGWVAAYDPVEGRQHVFYQEKFLVREGPRPPGKRGDVPERLVHA